jgi:hypothetical protein
MPGLPEQSLDPGAGIRTRANEHRGFVDLILRDGAVTLPQMDARELQ